MSTPQPPEYYEIRVAGVLDERWTTWFEGLQIRAEGTETVISGPLPDQPALHGVLIRVGGLGMRLISVRRVSPGEPGPEAAVTGQSPAPALDAAIRTGLLPCLREVLERGVVIGQENPHGRRSAG